MTAHSCAGFANFVRLQKGLPISMSPDEVLAEFRGCGALLEGHFLLSSGRHSAHYLQCARVLMNAERAARLAFAIAHLRIGASAVSVGAAVPCGRDLRRPSLAAPTLLLSQIAQVADVGLVPL